MGFPGRLRPVSQPAAGGRPFPQVSTSSLAGVQPGKVARSRQGGAQGLRAFGLPISGSTAQVEIKGVGGRGKPLDDLKGDGGSGQRRQVGERENAGRSLLPGLQEEPELPVRLPSLLGSGAVARRWGAGGGAALCSGCAQRPASGNQGVFLGKATGRRGQGRRNAAAPSPEAPTPRATAARGTLRALRVGAQDQQVPGHLAGDARGD